jgi:outer membrane protein OmpA-like peptidoglycan-associated protein
MVAGTSGCATKKFVRNSVSASADTLTARIEGNENEMKEIRDNLDKKVSTVDARVTTVDSRVSAVDEKATQGITTLRTDLTTNIQGVDQKAIAARGAADRAANDVNALGQKFQNRNQFNVANEKNIPFKFDSATLDKQYLPDIDQVADAVLQNADAMVILEGRTDSTGNKDYNVRLAERRIEAVRRYLAVEKGVPVYRIHEISFGAEKPIAENETRGGREKNRAVTLTVMIPKMEGSVASKND